MPETRASVEDATETTAIVVSGAGNAAPLGPLAPSDVNPVDAYLARLNTDASRRTAIASLKRALDVLGVSQDAWRSTRWAALGPVKAALLYRRLADRFRPATVRLTLSVVRNVLRRAKQLGQLDANRYDRVVDWARVGGESAPVGRMLTREEIDRLEAYCGTLPELKGAMLWAMLACGLGGGLRRFEIAGLSVDALSNDGRHLLVFGKGRKEAVQPIPAAVGGAIEAWLALRETTDVTSPTMFVPMAMNGRPIAGTDKPMSIDSVERAVAGASKGYGGKHFTPHDLRRTYGSTIMGSYDLSAAKRMMRHEDATTTARYDRRPEELSEQIASSLDARLFGR